MGAKPTSWAILLVLIAVVVVLLVALLTPFPF